MNFSFFTLHSLFGLSLIQDAFDHDVKAERVKHAYLIVGPEHSGKMTLVTEMAQKLQCPNDGCGTCATCSQIVNGVQADTFIHRDDGETLSVDTVRDVIIPTVNRTFTSKYLIILIEHIERASHSALNALLKTLEEPFDRVVFLLTARNIGGIPATVLSRVSRHHVPLPDKAQLQAFLETIYPQSSPSEITEVIRLGMSRVGMCITLLTDGDAREARTALFDRILSSFTSKPSERLSAFLSLMEESKEARATLEEALHIAQYIMHEQLLEKEGSMLRHVTRFEACERALQYLSRSVDPRLVAADFALRY